MKEVLKKCPYTQPKLQENPSFSHYLTFHLGTHSIHAKQIFATLFLNFKKEKKKEKLEGRIIRQSTPWTPLAAVCRTQPPPSQTGGALVRARGARGSPHLWPQSSAVILAHSSQPRGTWRLLSRGFCSHLWTNAKGRDSRVLIRSQTPGANVPQEPQTLFGSCWGRL